MGARVLLIGSNTELLGALRAHRPLAKATIDSSPNDADALQALQVRSWEVLLTDPLAPAGENLALADRVRAIRPGTRTIVLAPTAKPEDILAALKSQVFSIFSAPHRGGEIAAMVEYALDESEDWRDGIQVRSGLPYWITLRVSPRLVNAERLLRFMTEYRSDLPSSKRDDLMLAFREILLNAMEHGAGFDPKHVIEVSAARTARAIVYHFRDPGPGFDRTFMPQAALSNPPGDPLAHVEWRASHDLRPGGFGILIAKQLVDEMAYNEPGNEVLLIKYMS